MPRRLCLFVDLKDSCSVARRTLHTVASPSAAATVFHSLLSAVIPARLKCLEEPVRRGGETPDLTARLHPNGNKKPY